MLGQPIVNEGLLHTLASYQEAKLGFKKNSLEAMVYTEVKRLAQEAGKPVSVFLKVDISEIRQKITKIAGIIDTDDSINGNNIVTAIQLIAEGVSPDIIKQYNEKRESNLSFYELCELKKKFPHISGQQLMAYEEAKNDKDLASVAEMLLTEEQPPEAADLDVRFHPVISQISYLNIQDIKNSGLDAGKIFTQTNEADKEALEYRTEQARIAREETERRQKKYLANKKIELALKPTALTNEEYKNQLRKTTLLVRT